MERGAASLTVVEMHANTTTRCYLTPLRTAGIKGEKKQGSGGREESGTVCVAGGAQAGAAALENNMEVLQKIKNRVSVRSSKLAFGHLSEENETVNSKRRVPLCVHYKTVYANSPRVAATCMSVGGRAGKNGAARTHDRVLLSCRGVKACRLRHGWLYGRGSE